MTCRELTDSLADYFAGTLDTCARTALEAHLASCPDCIAYIRGYRETIRLAKASMPAAADMPDELIDAILETRGRGPHR